MAAASISLFVYCFVFVFIVVVQGEVELEVGNETTWRPVVLMHGLMASSEAMGHFQGYIEEDFPGIHVLNVEIGDGKPDSLLMNMNKQIEVFAAIVQNDTLLKNGFNVIGHSQGGLIVRAYVERYNDPPVHNLISLAGPYDGVYGVPVFNDICPDKDCPWLADLMSILDEGNITVEVQEHFTFASYWKDPFNYDLYLRDNIFLADINNERETKNDTYKRNIQSLNTMVLVHSDIDAIVVPRTSPWFEFYGIGEDSYVIPWKNTESYVHDWIGVKYLDENGRLVHGTVTCSHSDIPRDTCKATAYEIYTKPYLNNTLPSY